MFQHFYSNYVLTTYLRTATRTRLNDTSVGSIYSVVDIKIIRYESIGVGGKWCGRVSWWRTALFNPINIHPLIPAQLGSSRAHFVFITHQRIANKNTITFSVELETRKVTGTAKSLVFQTYNLLFSAVFSINDLRGMR